VKQTRQGAVRDGGAELGFDVVADQRQAALLEALAPVGLGGDEDRNAIDESAARRVAAMDGRSDELAAFVL